MPSSSQFSLQQISRILSRNFLFAALPQDTLNTIARFSQYRTISRGELLFSEGQFASALFLLVFGKVKIYKISPTGQEQILHIHKQNELIAEAAIFDAKNYPAYCQALEDSGLIRIPCNEFIELLLKQPQISLRLLSAYSKRLRYFVTMIEDLSLLNLKERLAKFILKNMKRKNDHWVCKLEISKKELAAMLGTIPETLSRTLSIFRNLDLLEEIEGDLLLVKNVNALRKMIQE